jgi:sigma-B regulation protein RsbU (phosphoserine phosphatase)
MDKSKTILESLHELTSEAIIGVNEAKEIILLSAGAEKIFGYSQAEALGHPVSILLPEKDHMGKLSVVVEQTPASVVMTDIDGNIEYVNPAFERITGYILEEVKGKKTSILKSGITPIELYQSMWQTITAGDVWSGELCNRRKNGELFWELGTVSPIRNKQGEITNYISIKEEITDKKKIEKELNRYRLQLEELVQEGTAELREEIEEHRRTEMQLREKEQTLDLALHIGQLGSWEYNLRTEEMYWADEVYRIFGLSPGDTRITYQSALLMVHPDDQAVVRKSMDEAVATRQSLNIDHKIVLKDGQERIINLTIVPIFDSFGAPIKMIGTVQNITERVRIKAELLEKERMTNELDIGKSIQLSMLPKASPLVEGWQFAGFYQAARQVGGDFYDFIDLPGHKIGLLIGDVAGKGLPAALSMALCRAIIRTNALRNSRARATLLRSNEILYRDYYNGSFATVLYANLDPNNGAIELVNAGHNPPLWYSSENRQVQSIKPHGMPLGFYPRIQLEPVEIDLMPGDVLVCYTDGLTEAINLLGDFHNEERLVETVVANAGLSASEIVDAIVESWHDFVGELPQDDDMTLLVVKRLG